MPPLPPAPAALEKQNHGPDPARQPEQRDAEVQGETL